MLSATGRACARPRLTGLPGAQRGNLPARAIRLPRLSPAASYSRVRAPLAPTPNRGAVRPLRSSLQVDAVMRSTSHTANPQPSGCVAAAALAQTGTLRLRIAADTFRGATRLVRGA